MEQKNITVKKPKIVKLDLFILVVLTLVIGLSVLFVGGLNPGNNFKLTPYSDTQSYTPSNPSQQAGADKGLQLSLIKLKSCSSTVAVNFLVDNSGSMGWGKKLVNLRNAILSFKNKLADESIIGLQTFSEDWENLIKPTEFKNVKESIHKTVCSIGKEGGTYTRDAFSKTEKVLDEAIAKYPGYKFALIFISDGVPETMEEDNVKYPDCLSSEFCSSNPDTTNRCRCFAKKQDPTNFYDTSLVDIPQRIKDKGVKIFSIAFVDTADAKINEKLESLLKRTASSPESEYYYRAPSEEDITTILEQIASKICQESK
jgi:hypothetical protein